MSSPAPDPARRPLKSRSTAWARSLTAALVARRVSPNTISLASICAALAGAAAITSSGLPVWLGSLLGAICVQLRLLCNLLDGLVAVEGGLKSKAGDLFNEAPDRVADVALLVAAGYACGQPAVGWTCSVLALTTAYLRALGASLGLGQDYRGPGAKPHRMAALTVGLLGAMACAFAGIEAPVLAAALWVILFLTGITVIRRTQRIYQRLP